LQKAKKSAEILVLFGKFLYNEDKIRLMMVKEGLEMLRKRKSWLLKVCPMLIALAGGIVMQSSVVFFIGEPKIPAKLDSV